MVTFNAHFDGKVLVPDEPLALKPNQKVRISVEPVESAAPAGKLPLGLQRGNVLYLAPDFDDPLPDDLWRFGDEK